MPGPTQNVCRHRGSELVLAKSGNRSHALSGGTITSLETWIPRATCRAPAIARNRVHLTG